LGGEANLTGKWVEGRTDLARSVWGGVLGCLYAGFRGKSGGSEWIGEGGGTGVLLFKICGGGGFRELGGGGLIRGLGGKGLKEKEWGGEQVFVEFEI